MSFDESKIIQFVEKYIFPILETGDPLWDKPHARAAAFHMQKLWEANPRFKLDHTTMLLAAYMHDIGYAKFYRPGAALSREEYLLAKQQHMEVGQEMAAELLTHIELTPGQRAEIVHLNWCA